MYTSCSTALPIAHQIRDATECSSKRRQDAVVSFAWATPIILNEREAKFRLNRRTCRAVEDDPLLALYGSGKDLWADEHADEYVRRLREGWE
jgi:hypothetical protein